MTHFWATFWTYLRWSLEFLNEPPFVYTTLLLGSNFIASVIRQSHCENHLETNLLHCRSAILILPAMLAVAVLGNVDRSSLTSRDQMIGGFGQQTSVTSVL